MAFATGYEEVHPDYDKNADGSDSSQLTGSVFLLEGMTNYEGGAVLFVFSQKEDAENRKAKIEAERADYWNEMHETNYESDRKMPEHGNWDYYCVTEFALIPPNS